MAVTPALRATIVGIFKRHTRSLGFIGHTISVTAVRETKRGYSATIVLQQGTGQRRYKGTLDGTRIRMVADGPAERILAPAAHVKRRAS